MRSELRPWAATVLSFVVAGLGHLYVGRYVKGLFYIFLEVAAYLGLVDYPEVFLLFTFALEVWASFDAYRIALNQNREEPQDTGGLKITSFDAGSDKELKEIDNNKEEKGIYVSAEQGREA